uniref:Uncharacterized protein n=1 Tax=Anguilla anguilla TaxID=7936 RepID=A0A0E9RUC6_ANGAN
MNTWFVFFKNQIKGGNEGRWTPTGTDYGQQGHNTVFSLFAISQFHLTKDFWTQMNTNENSHLYPI